MCTHRSLGAKVVLPSQQPPGPLRDASEIRAAVGRFGAELAPRMRGDGRREDQLRAPIYALLKAVGRVIGRGVVVHDEVTLAHLSSRPDFAVDTASGRVGYIELKAPEKGIPENWRPTKHDREQWNKLRDLPNLIYTNGTYWALYRKGILVGQVAALEGDLARAGNRLAPADGEFERLMREFLVWTPARPMTLRGVVSEVAPLCRLLRDQVAETMDHERKSPGRRPLTRLANEWREILFPTLNDRAFADAYAQAVTFSLLLARVDAISFEERSLSDIAEQLSKQHSLMGEALSILTNPKWVSQLSVVETMRRVIGNIDWADVGLGESDAYALLYETFLAAYDPKLRRKSGTYYTPDPVARAMVGFADQVLKARLHKARGFAADEVIVVDPAMGTGTFLVEIIRSVVATLNLERGANAVPSAHLRELFANRLVGFELQAAPYAVAELRLHHTLKSVYGVELPREEVRFLSNAFDDPDTQAFEFGQLYEVLKEVRDGANRFKRKEPVMVVIGNPPWRERAAGEAPWVEAPRGPEPAPIDLQIRPSLDEFRSESHAKKAYNLSNMWTFFWRWGTWKVFDANPREPAGIVSLITPSAYVASESYAGMRRYLRETADEGWIIELSPEGFQPDTPTRVFPGVQQTICIGVFARYGPARREHPAKIWHTSISGSQQDKFEQLLALKLDGDIWHACPEHWEEPFQPADSGWITYPRLADLLPWHQPGVKSNRNWVYAPDEETLRGRWDALVHSAGEEKAELFKVTGDRSIDKSYPELGGVPSSDVPLCDERSAEPRISPIAFRSFDRQYMIYDRRVVDRPRSELWQVYSAEQVYVTEPPGYRFQCGPALAFSSLVPDMHYFMGHHGGRARPLYRDRTTSAPNIAPGLLARLSAVARAPVNPADLLAYIAGTVANSLYSYRFRDELTAPGIRVPITADVDLWWEAVRLGSEVLWLHTYGERYFDPAAGRPHARPRMPEAQRPRYTSPVPASELYMRDDLRYDSARQAIVVGERTLLHDQGLIEPVSPAMWAYAMPDGVSVIRRWFDFRRLVPRNKKRTSRLDEINSSRWTAEFDDQFIDLLNVIGRCVALEQPQAEILDQICAGPMVSMADLESDGILPVPGIYKRAPSYIAEDCRAKLF